MSFIVAIVVAAFCISARAWPRRLDSSQVEAAADNTVLIEGKYNFCMIMPRTPHTDIGDSEHPGGTRSYCSPAAHSSSTEGELPSNFWSNVEYLTASGANGSRFVQLTGCIRPSLVESLNPHDRGGQYDSSGGSNGEGNPQESVCRGYNHYVELVEPAGNRACIRCCDDPTDCPTNKDTSGCPAVIPGNYFNCD